MKARVLVIMSGTKELIDLFTASRLTESVRAQLSSRVSWHYLLPELSLAEAKVIIEVALCRDATDEAVAQIFNLTSGVCRRVDMVIPRVLQLKEQHREKLEGGEVRMKDLISTAGSRLIIG